jgi:hypothetical protein
MRLPLKSEVSNVLYNNATLTALKFNLTLNNGWVSTERDLASCMAKEYVFALGQLAISGHSQHPSHGFAGIHRVQQNALCCSDLFHRVYGQRVPLAYGDRGIK